MASFDRVDRRAFLRLAPVGAAGVDAFLLAACQPAPNATPPTAAPASAQPTAVAAASAAAQPDRRGAHRGRLSRQPYRHLLAKARPAQQRRVDRQRLPELPSPSATPLENNRSWQEVNRQLNTQVRMNFATPADYIAKLAALMAGNDLPDIFALWQGL